MTFSLDLIAQHYPTVTKLGLERILSLLARLGSPHHRLPPTIHVAGTNGKGSTISLMRAMLEAAHKRVHVYTSPHLVKFNERIVLAGQEIEDRYLLDLIERCRKEEPQDITWFELTTAAAFLAFSEVPADFLLVETGVGGRLDATNVLENPVLTVITSLSIDHTEYLGETLEEISREKAGILKKGCPLVACCHPIEAQKVILSRAQELKCPVFSERDTWQITEKRDHLEFIWEGKAFKFPHPSLSGIHQIQNAGLALAAGFYLGLDPSSCSKGLSKASWPGRLQRLPSTPGIELWLDGAHNPDGAKVILETLLRWKKEDGLPLYIIIGMIKNKDHETFLSIFQSHVERLFIVPVQNPYQKMDPHILYDKARKLGFSAVLSQSVQKALQHIDVQREKKPVRVLICGSLYLAGEVLAEEKLSSRLFINR